MNGSIKSVQDWVAQVSPALNTSTVEACLCLPAILLPYAQQSIEQAASSLALGGQNASHQKSGALTGEISPSMFKESGCTFVLVGHSERRAYYGESDQIVALKAQAALDDGLIPIVCIGESAEENAKGETQQVLDRQLTAIAEQLPNNHTELCVAYEPVWAIGTGKAASLSTIQNICAWIQRHSFYTQHATRLLYGGSVNADNIMSISQLPEIDGALIGSASLNADSFISMLSTA